MKIIKDDYVDALIRSSNFNNNEFDIRDSEVVIALNKYLVFEDSKLFLNDFSVLDIFYNKYYRYLIFLNLYKQRIGFDAGIEQKEFILLEEGSNIIGLDWTIIEQISNTVGNR